MLNTFTQIIIDRRDKAVPPDEIIVSKIYKWHTNLKKKKFC